MKAPTKLLEVIICYYIYKLIPRDFFIEYLAPALFIYFGVSICEIARSNLTKLKKQKDSNKK